jgi:predicted N-formylglutamate amidohydrolase
LSEADRMSHIAWDIGIAEVARRLATLLGASLVLQNYSRLVIDCNRPLSAPDSIVRQSAGVTVPGNANLSTHEIDGRAKQVFRPYHAWIEGELDRRLHAAQKSIYVALHSFTPELLGVARPWHVGVLYQRDARLAQPMLRLLGTEAGLVVGENEPYRVTDHSDYSLVTHGEKRGLLHVELEVRQDLIAETSGQAAWAARLARHLSEAVRAVGAH